MDKEYIVDYATRSPENTNKAVLRSMLDSIDEGGGGLPYVVIPVHRNEQGYYVLEKTWQEIYDIVSSSTMAVTCLTEETTSSVTGQRSIFNFVSKVEYVDATAQEGPVEWTVQVGNNSSNQFYATSANDYPTTRSAVYPT